MATTAWTLLFLGDDYTTTASLDMFRSDVSYMANYFRQVEPYAPNVINVRTVAAPIWSVTTTALALAPDLL
ncbi:hypothetical protein [Candidatus Amarolinea dominans]|uniref:hypothetical protein n=1 Tax=Candidatus Amarolinea dominans TaxID=3140696 RepID=UPI00313536EA|nr:hypothetical protein [Anaerolineae bacterium]